jgi:GPH family glycoside/pentoside/hexuronide:cation symporter
MYLLYFLTYPVGLGAGKASYALLSGQIADGVATNLVGLFIDKTNTRIGKKKPWYIIGFILVVPTFILTFNTCAL